MDYDGAIAVLNEHKRLIAECEQTFSWSKERNAARDRMNEHSPAVDPILSQLGLGAIGVASLTRHRNSVSKINHALSLLADRRIMFQVNVCLGQPALPMGLLHPLVSNVARPLWDNGNYRHAVADAATNISNYTQNKMRRHDISDRELMAQAFSDNAPERGKPRLRCPGRRQSQTTRSLQQGALQFAVGTFQAIRNQAHHSTGDGEPGAAFEDLAALSKVARWVSDWSLDEYVQPIDFEQLTAASQALARARKTTPTS